MYERLPDEIIAVQSALAGAGIPHAFGGAIALAYWGTPRFTHVVDINIFLPTDRHSVVLDALGSLFHLQHSERTEAELMRSAQTRLQWDTLPIDLFFIDTPFHEAMATRTRVVDYVGTPINVISPEDLIVCKTLFNRPKDWIDIENIVTIQPSLNEQYLQLWLSEFCEPDDERIRRVDALMLERHHRDLGGETE